MITCTKCGEQNSDETRFCSKCNNKLQSSRKAAPTEEARHHPLEHFQHEGVPTDSWRALMRMVEAWAYVLVLLGVGAGCAYFTTWWPMYPTVGILGLLLWFRRV
ncbi:hypothetical protein PSDVSF_33490 [Pseudodesulfovibrio sediminis]|uniref:Zinc-ribbon domain-containing protein n=1 Tax=Pseudodesulfovibrio sediminis TaxID=2810563 RepID=A0ABN6EXG1_9BACT|nr:hypothetical protein PSDVSF_33490 [Pseudodesulfovibrio sediminis]